MGYPAYEAPSQEQIEAQQRAAEQRKKDSHADGLKGHEKQISDYKKLNAEFPLSTDFTAHDIDQLKGMIEHANPDGVDQIGGHWKRVHDKLVGEGGGGAPSGDSAYGQLKKAVDGVLEHWEGESANQFKTKANDILQQIANGASHASNVSQVMTRAADDLRTQRDAISKIEKPGWFSKAWDAVTDSGRDDKYTQADVKSGNIPKDLIAKANEGYIGAEKEEQLKAVSIMETLGRSYVGYSRVLKGGIDEGRHDGVPPSNPDTPMPTPIPTPSGSASVPSSRGRAKTSTGLASTSKVPETTGPRDPGITGGQQSPVGQTKVDGLPSGFSGGGVGSVGGGGSVSGAGTSGGVGAVAGAGATAGVPGGGMLGGSAAAGGAARGAGGRAGIGGAGGMGRGGGAAAGGKGAGGAVGRGALARAKGGVAGAPKGISGGKPATPGGTGLGKGRGGAGAAGRGNGMLGGGARGTNQQPGDEENDEGSRPDYLIEDEETWTPEDSRSVPRTIE